MFPDTPRPQDSLLEGDPSWPALILQSCLLHSSLHGPGTSGQESCPFYLPKLGLWPVGPSGGRCTILGR